MERGGNSMFRKQCASAYKVYQMSRLLTIKIGENNEITSRAIASLIAAKGISSRKPETCFYRREKQILIKGMENSRLIEMAAIEEYAKILRKAGHKVHIHVARGTEMEAIRLRAA